MDHDERIPFTLCISVSRFHVFFVVETAIRVLKRGV